MIKNRYKIILLLLSAFVVLQCNNPDKSENGFVEVDGTRFTIDGEPYLFVGANFWYGAYLGSPGPEGDRERLQRELDLLKQNGVTNLRIAASSQAAAHQHSLYPVFQPSADEVNENLLEGLDYLLAEMGKRDMKAVLFLNNFWEWSGGMSAYSEWFGEGPVIDPSGGDWHGFMNHSARFYFNEQAQQAWRDYIEMLINRENSLTGTVYYDDPVIMSWQLANEPRPGSGEEGEANIPRYIEWVDESAAFIKSLAPNQLVSTGNEGTMGSLYSEDAYLDAHRSEHIDYMTFHMWAKNWGWFDADDMEGTFPQSLENARDYINQHVAYAGQLNKPTVLSEFGLGRDFENHEVGSPVTYRDEYLSYVFSIIEEKAQNGEAVAGTNFWSWGGEGQAMHEDAMWRAGDPFTGDPPQEPQGLNSIFSGDESTLGILSRHAQQLEEFSSR